MFNILIMIYEIIFYSLFMKFARKEGKLSRYAILYLMICILFGFLGTKEFYSYLLLILIMLFGFKYIVKTKTSLFDMLIIIIMLITKVLVEFFVFIIFYYMLHCSHFITTLLFELLKILLVLLINTNLNKLYLKLKKLWDNNNFYIRYIASVSLYAYVIVTIVLLILYKREV